VSGKGIAEGWWGVGGVAAALWLITRFY